MVKQIAGAVARRIVCEAHPGRQLEAGQRYGMVKFGSRVELFVPREDQIDVAVKVGDKGKAGLNVLAWYRSDARVPGSHGPEREPAEW